MIYRLGFGDVGEVRGAVELVVPRVGPARYEAVFSGEELGDGFLVVRDLEVPPPRRADVIELRGDGLWVEMTCETPDEHWSFGLEAFGLRVDDPEEAVGDRIPVGYDLEWETPDLVHGELLVGSARFGIAATGTWELEVDGGELL